MSYVIPQMMQQVPMGMMGNTPSSMMAPPRPMPPGTAPSGGMMPQVMMQAVPVPFMMPGGLGLEIGLGLGLGHDAGSASALDDARCAGNGWALIITQFSSLFEQT